MSRPRVIAVAALSVFTLLTAAVAGPLQPAAGPVTPTMKPLTEVEPRTAINATNTPGDATAMFKITQPGSYYLTGELAVTAGKHGILVAANNVTIDLNGFSISPAAGVSTAQAGVYGQTARNVTVRNGVVRSLSVAGVVLGGDSCRAENVSVYSCPAGGVYLSGKGCVIDGCVVDTSTGPGALTGENGTIRGCVVVGAHHGIETGDGSLISGCIAAQNTGQGFDCGCGSTVVDCTSKGNAQLGFFMCASTMTGCNASNNTGPGIQAGSSSNVKNCVGNNNSQGIVCLDRCLLEGNHLVLSANEAIVASGSWNRIERNSVVSATKGIKVESSNNLIIGNSVTDTTTAFQFVSNNRYGAIVNTVGLAAPAVNGSTAASTLGTTDPNANIVH